MSNKGKSKFIAKYLSSGFIVQMLISTCRCEAFNSCIRAQNIYGNKQAPSRDICNRFAVIEHIRYICEGGFLPSGKR